MKKNVHPAVALVIILLVLGVVAWFLWEGTRYDTGQAPGIHKVKPKGKT